MEIVVDDLTGEAIARFLDEHLEDMRSISPPESKHALDLEGLRVPEVTFWTVLDAGQLFACGAIKELDQSHAEVKSMRTDPGQRGRGTASMLREYIIGESKRRGYSRISLETGSMDYFLPARNLYLKHGFEFCPPFAAYVEDPNSVFMTLNLG